MCAHVCVYICIDIYTHLQELPAKCEEIQTLNINILIHSSKQSCQIACISWNYMSEKQEWEIVLAVLNRSNICWSQCLLDSQITHFFQLPTDGSSQLESNNENISPINGTICRHENGFSSESHTMACKRIRTWSKRISCIADGV